MRVPTPDGSITDFVAVLKKKTTKEEVNAAFKKGKAKKKENRLHKISFLCACKIQTILNNLALFLHFSLNASIYEFEHVPILRVHHS